MTTPSGSSTPDLLLSQEVESTFKLMEGIYLLGSLQKGVTVYGQQVRAHNLMWSLWELSRYNKVELGPIAIVGGGIRWAHRSGMRHLTFQECVNHAVRAAVGSLSPSAGIGQSLAAPTHLRLALPRKQSAQCFAASPKLVGRRASDVARELLLKFGRYCQTFLDRNGNDLRIYLGLGHLRITRNQIEWMGQKTIRREEFFHIEKPEGKTEKFKTIILAPGFGVEINQSTPSYWRNDQLSQPILNGARRLYVVSGYGDGAIVDLCRLTIERFRQDTILYELFSKGLEREEENLRKTIDGLGGPDECNLYNALSGFNLDQVQESLAQRVRKDVRVVLHATGKGGKNKSLEKLFAPGSSILHRFILYLLYRCAAFTTSFDKLDAISSEHQISENYVVSRYGTDRMSNVLDLFSDPASVHPRLKSMDAGQAQRAKQLWKPGSFPHLP